VDIVLQAKCLDETVEKTAAAVTPPARQVVAPADHASVGSRVLVVIVRRWRVRRRSGQNRKDAQHDRLGDAGEYFDARLQPVGQTPLGQGVGYDLVQCRPHRVAGFLRTASISTSKDNNVFMSAVQRGNLFAP
jgi:hypothetical protein